MLNGCSTFAILGLRWQSLEITQMEKKNIWILAQKICCQHSRLHYQQQDFFVAIFKKKVFENHQKSINLLQHEQRYLNFRAKKTYTFIGEIRANFLFVIYTVFFSCAIFFGLSTLFSGLVYFYVASVHLFSVAIP